MESNLAHQGLVVAILGLGHIRCEDVVGVLGGEVLDLLSEQLRLHRKHGHLLAHIVEGEGEGNPN